MKQPFTSLHSFCRGVLTFVLLFVIADIFAQNDFTLRNPSGEIYHIAGDFTKMDNMNLTLKIIMKIQPIIFI